FVWSKFYGTNGVNEEINDLLLTKNNEIVFVGSAGDFTRALIAKCDLNGGVKWYREIDHAPFDEFVNAVIELGDGSLVAAGFTFPNEVYSQILILKLNDAGETIWERELGEEKKIDIAYDIAETADRGFVIAGY